MFQCVHVVVKFPVIANTIANPVFMSNCLKIQITYGELN